VYVVRQVASKVGFRPRILVVNSPQPFCSRARFFSRAEVPCLTRTVIRTHSTLKGDADDGLALPGEILDVKRGMVENIDRVLDRGEKIDLLVDKAATLHSDAFRFKRTTRQVRRTFWWQHYGYLVGGWATPPTGSRQCATE